MGVVVAVLLAAGWLFAATRQGESVEAARVERAVIRQYVDERGKTRLPRQHLITMPIDGRVEQISLDANDPVAAGQIVARVSQQDLDLNVAEATAVVERLDASIRENDDTTVELTTRRQAVSFVASMEHTVAAAEARMTSGEARLTYARTNYERTKGLQATGAKTTDDLEQANVALVEAQVNYRQDVLVWRAMQAIEAATALLPDLISQYITRKDLAKAVLEQQRAEAAVHLREIELQRQRGAMTSPVDGVVLERLVENERFLAAGTELLRIGRLEELEVEADILSQDAVEIRPGQRVEIYGPAVGAAQGQGVAGRVKRINPAGFTKISSLGVEQQRVTVIISFDDGVLPRLRETYGIGVEYRVRVRIFTAERQDALVVPRSALFRGGDARWQVFAVRDGVARLTPVEVGLLNDQQAEITAGLAAEEIVVLAPETSLEPGDRVSPLLRESKLPNDTPED